MDRLEAMRLFVRVLERRSFARAAEDLGVPRSTATQVIRRLEERLGARLLERTTRSVRPTLDGEAYHRRCVAILDDIENAEGALRVDVHGTLARHVLLPGLPEFLARYPGIALEMSEGDRLADPVREGIDCVLRAGAPRDSGMILRRVGLLPEATLAAPGYLARHGRPDSLAALDAGDHRMIGFRSSATGGLLPLCFAEAGRIHERVLPCALTVTAAESYVAAARLGLGIVQLPRYHAEAALAEGTLVELLPGLPPPPLPASLLYPSNRQLSARVRVFIDWVVARFAAVGAGQQARSKG